MSFDDAFNAPFPCAVKINAVDAGKNINRARLPAETYEVAGLREVFDPDIIEWRTKAGQRRKRGSRVGCVCFNEQVDILGGAGLRMKRDSLAAHNKIFNAVGVEGRQEVFEVLEHQSPSPDLSWRMQPW